MIWFVNANKIVKFETDERDFTTKLDFKIYLNFKQLNLPRI